jgi:hypothetical protein
MAILLMAVARGLAFAQGSQFTEREVTFRNGAVRSR